MQTEILHILALLGQHLRLCRGRSAPSTGISQKEPQEQGGGGGGGSQHPGTRNSQRAVNEAGKIGGGQLGKDPEVKFRCVDFIGSQGEVLGRDGILETSAEGCP